MSGKYDHINFKPPESVASAAEKGLEYRSKASPSNKGGLTSSEAGKAGIGSGVQRAVNLKNRNELSPSTVKRMHSFFSRHKGNESIGSEHKGEPWNDKGYVAWLLWGGNPGAAWARKIVNQMEAADKKSKAHETISGLVKLADDLDRNGYYKEASEVDAIISKLSLNNKA
jgi:hypothetical protein